MLLSELEVPDEVVQMNLAANGEAGRAWLEALPAIVEHLVIHWDLTIGPAFGGGCVAFVAPAERQGEERAVLKVTYVDEETRHEADALARWGGEGAVRLLDSDPDRGALLLERLEPGTFLADHRDRDEAISIACRLLRRLWRPVPEPHPFTAVRDLALRWARELEGRFHRLGRPFEASLVSRGIAACLEAGVCEEEPVLANRDYHLWNVLSAGREPWLLIDPKPLVGERAFDTGHLLRTLIPSELDAGAVTRLIGRLADELGVGRDRIRSWALIRSVEDALWGLEVKGSDARWDLECARLLAHLSVD